MMMFLRRMLLLLFVVDVVVVCLLLLMLIFVMVGKAGSERNLVVESTCNVWTPFTNNLSLFTDDH